MRILMLTSRMDIGGAESHIYTLSAELVRLGHRVIVASAGGRSVSALEDSGVRHVTLPLDKKDPASVWLSRSGISRLMDKFRPDAVHSHSRIPSFIYGEMSAESASAPLVTTVHMPFSYDPLTEWGEAQIAVSRDLALYLEENYGIPASGVSVIENGVDIRTLERACGARGSVRARFGIPEGALVISCATRSSASRAESALYLAVHARRLLRRGEYMLLCISGGVGRERDLAGEIRSAAEEANTALGRRAVILVEGESDVAQYIAASDIFVGVSRAAIEAMGCGIPVIIAGNEGVGGILSPRSVHALRESNLTGRGCGGDFGRIGGMIDRLRDPELREALGRYSLGVAREEYSARVMAEATLAVYREAVRPSLLLLGHYGAENRGDDASLAVIRSQLSHKWSIRALSRSERSCEGGIARFDARRIYRAAHRADAVILGTGNLIQDETSLRSLAYYRALVALCKKANPRLAVFANGIGPLCRAASVRMAEGILSSAEYISLREPDSLAFCRMLSLSAEPRLGADIALLLEPGREPAQSLPERGEYFAVCPRGGQSARDTRALREFAAKAHRRGITPLYIPMDGREDTELCLELAEGDTDRVLLGASAPLIAEVISRACFTVGGRLHAAVLSASVDTPFVGYDRDGRTASFCAYSECGECLASDEFDARELARTVERERIYHASRPYRERTEALRAAARADFARLTEWIEKQSRGRN